MTDISQPNARFADLPSRAVIAASGPDWRDFLQGLLTQDVESLAPGEIRFAAMLTPQGRLLYDLFLLGREDGCLIDVAAGHRPALLHRLRMYRLRAKVELADSDATVAALWGTDAAPPGWSLDPRAPGLGWRGYPGERPAGAAAATEADCDAHRLALGLPGPADWGHDKAYPIEANFDLLGGIDFKKGCFVGQETTSRMKRRGVVKSRMAPVVIDGAPPEAGAALLAGGLRAGEVTSAGTDGAVALLRLDRLAEGALTLEDGRPWRVTWPPWMAGLTPP